MQIAPARRGKLRDQGILPQHDPFKARVPLRVHGVMDFISAVKNGEIALGAFRGIGTPLAVSMQLQEGHRLGIDWW
jgi:hypothetical protein